MKKAILICDNGIYTLEKYDIVFSLGKLIELELKSKNLHSINIYEIKIPFNNKKIQSDIENNLELESKISGKTRWVNLTIQHVLWKYIYYYQFKERLLQLIKTYEIGDFTLSSSSNKYLQYGFKAACLKSKINFKINKGNSVLTSTVTPLTSTFDLPFGQNILEVCVAKLLSFYYRFNRTKIFFENNNQINTSGSKFSFRRSISFLGIYLPKFTLNSYKSIIDLEFRYKEKSIFRLNKNLWVGFDSFDLRFISLILDDFFKKYNSKYLDNLFKSLFSFFEISRAKKIILSSDNTCSSRFLSYTARKAGLEVNFLPHGIMQSYQYLKTGSEFGVDKILSWNQSESDYLLNEGKNAINFQCPLKLKSPKSKINYGKKNLSKLKILVLLPEWVGLTLKSRPDCFENDFFTIQNSLIKLGINEVYLKYHNAIDISNKKKEEVLKRLTPLSKINFKVIPPEKKTIEIFNDFDLVIVGATTGIIELAISATPFILFRAFLSDLPIFNNINFPSANSENKLTESIINYDFMSIDDECMKLYLALKSQ